MVEGQPGTASDLGPSPRALGRAHARLLRGWACSEASEAATATPVMVRSRSVGRSSALRGSRSSENSKVQQTNAAHEGHQEAVYALSQLHSYDWLTFNAAWAAVLLATGLGARRNGMLPSWLAWATIVLGATQLTPIGFLGSLFIPPWLIVVGIWLFWKSKVAVRQSSGWETTRSPSPRHSAGREPAPRRRFRST